MGSQEVIIIGGGLSGLTLAYRLKKQGIKALVLEGRGRLGGRIETISHNQVTLELGATWFADKHSQLNQLIEELGLEKIPQEYGQYAIYEMRGQSPVLYPLPQQPELTYRIKGGSQQLIQQLATGLEPDQIRFNETVQSLDFNGNGAKVTTHSNTYEAQKVVSTLPPNLLVSSVKSAPTLPEELIELSQQTHTWMGESIKVGFYAEKDFWSEKGIGTLYSQTGPIVEMYDHSNEHGSAMKGFVNDQLEMLEDPEREAMTRSQLTRLFGKDAVSQIKLVQKNWKNEALTYASYQELVLPHQNNGHVLFRKPLFDQRLYLAGSETANAFPGYMDGAVEAAHRVAKELVLGIKKTVAEA